MFNEFMDFVDDILIDKVFQPVCDFIRKTVGWSKKVPAGISGLVCSITGIPLAYFLFSGGGFATFFALLLFIWISFEFCISLLIIHSEFTSNQEHIQISHKALFDNRITHVVDRKLSLVLTCINAPFLLAALSIPDMGVPVMCYAVSLFTNICMGYFRACSDLPQAETRLTGVLDGIRNHF